MLGLMCLVLWCHDTAFLRQFALHGRAVRSFETGLKSTTVSFCCRLT